MCKKASSDAPATNTHAMHMYVCIMHDVYMYTPNSSPQNNHNIVVKREYTHTI